MSQFESTGFIASLKYKTKKQPTVDQVDKEGNPN